MEEEPEYDVLGGYLPDFVAHLKDSRARLGLTADSQDNEGQIDAEREVEEDAEPHALPSWTATERDAFFRAVSVYSRWRPDLIAACVPTKTEWEVWMYLEALESASALAQRASEEDVDMEMKDAGDVETQSSGSASDSDSDLDSNSDMEQDDSGAEDAEELCEPALEVSQDWIDAEEYMAAWIINGEHLASVESDTVATTEDKPPRRKRRRSLGTKKARKARGGAGTVPNEDSPPPASRSPSSSPEPTGSRRRPRRTSVDPARKREALMRRLSAPQLLALDSVLREGVEATNDWSESRGASMPTENRHDGTPGEDVSSLPDQIDGLSGTGNVPEPPSNVATDPAAGRQVVNESARVPTQGPSPLPQPGTGDISMSPADNTTPGPDPNANTDPELLSLSPRSRRRIQKRLYMRRQRALLRGDGVPSEGVQDTTTAKLKPGKKAKSDRKRTSVTVSPSETPFDGEEELLDNVPKKHNKPGLRLPYKLKAQFAELGVDGTYLRNQGMDLLNLGALGRLMGLYFSLEHNEEEADVLTVAESIDAELIRYLQASLVSFVTDVIHRAIVWREREIRSKQRSRVWRQGDQITIASIEHAVNAIGARYHSHKTYFKSLEVLHGLFTEDSATATEPNLRDASVDPDVGTAELLTGLPELSIFRDAYTPLVCPPSAWKLSPVACLTRTYEREATRTRRGASAEIDEDGLMSDETDEGTLAVELAEEDEVDRLDMATSATHEGVLWGKIKK